MHFIADLIRLLIARPDYWPFAFMVPIFLALWLLVRINEGADGLNRVQGAWPVIGLLTLALFGWFCLVHLFSPIYLGPIQPQIAEVSWYFAQGLPIYHGPANSEVYNMLYGPDIYILTGWFEKLLGPSAFSFKLPGALAVAMAMLVFFLHLRKRAGIKIALFGTGVAAAFFLSMNPEELFSRPDVLIVLALVIGCWAAYSQSKIAPLVLGAAIGTGINLKIHAGLYFLPFIGVAWQMGYRTRSWLLVVSSAAVMTAAPFLLFSNVSLVNYLWTLRLASNVGINPMNYFNNLEMIFCLATPLVAASLLAYRQNAHATLNGLAAQKYFILLVLAEFSLLLLPCSRYGCGIHHLLPLGIVVIVLAVELYAAGVRPMLDNSFVSCAAGAVLLSWLVSCLGIGLVRSYQNAAYLQGRAAWAHSVESDVDQIAAQYGSHHVLLMGASDNDNYEYAYFRPQLIFKGQPIGFDPCGLMERGFVGSAVPGLPELTAALAKNHPDEKIIWLVPKHGDQFSLTSYFAFYERNGYLPNPPAYTDQFRASFLASTTKIATTQYYDLYTE